MLTLSWWESFLIGMVLSFLTALAPKLTNPVELAALQSAITFLQSLLGGTVGVVDEVAHPAARKP
jgi:hypothetical protein